MKTEIYILPAHWACAFINGDLSGYDSDDLEAQRLFIDAMVSEHGQCWALSCDEESGFLKYHDATGYGVLACDCLEYVFDVTPR